MVDKDAVTIFYLTVMIFVVMIFYLTTIFCSMGDDISFDGSHVLLDR